MSKFWFYFLATYFQKFKSKTFKFEKTLILGHRGLIKMHLENTFLSLKEAFLKKADGIEFDIQMSKDHVPVVFHDDKLNRLTHVKGYINDYIWEDLKKIKQDKHNYKEIYYISSLEEILENLPKEKILNIELKETILKNKVENINNIINILNKYKDRFNIILSSFSLAIIKELIKHKKFKIGLLLPTKISPFYVCQALLILKNIDYLNPHQVLLNDYISKKIKEKNVPLIIWGHHKPHEERHYFSDNHFALITDIADYFKKN